MPSEDITLIDDSVSVITAGEEEILVLRDPEVQIVDTNPADTVIVYEPEVMVVEIGSGPQGPPGRDGLGLFYRFVQGIPSPSWIIAHNLGEYLNVTVVDTAYTQVEATVTYLNADTIRIDFSAPIAGEAYIS